MHGIGTGRPGPMTVFGEISVSPLLPAGRYADQILVSVFF
jgi:spore coat protein U-like protein